MKRMKEGKISCKGERINRRGMWSLMERKSCKNQSRQKIQGVTLQD